MYIIISILSGIILAGAFPWPKLHWVEWFALAPLMYYTYKLTWKRAIISSLAFGMGFFLALLYWIAVFSVHWVGPAGYLPWVMLSLYQALFIVGFAASSKWLGERLGSWGRFVLLPSLWVIFEWLRSLGMFGFTWGDLGYSQYKVLPILQIAGLAGVWGISFLLAASNAAIANIWAVRYGWGQKRDVQRQVIILIAVVLMAGLNFLTATKRAENGNGMPLRVAVVQGNIRQESTETVEYAKQTWETYRMLTAQAGGKGAQLIVWPETVVPGMVGNDPFVQRELTDIAKLANAQLLVGGWDQDYTGKVYNSAFFIDPRQGVRGRYSKVHLVPFGEFVPARKLMPFLSYFRVTPFDNSPGPGYNLLDSGSYRLGTAICFESTFPHISRRLTASGAELLCIITNDCWFDTTAAAEEHMAMSVLRAVENGRYVVRGATTGVSTVISPTGEILTSAGLRVPAVLTEVVHLRTGKTLYTHLGDWIIIVSFIIVLLTVIKRAPSLRRLSTEDTHRKIELD